MTREERQLYNFIERFKRHIQDHLYFKPLAISNLHHLSDRLLDKCNGDFYVNFKLFKKNIKEMLKYSQPITINGENIVNKLKLFTKNGKNINDFVNIVYRIYEDYE